MPTKPAPSCPCVPAHSPVPLAFQVHHVQPRAWLGPDVPANRATICGTCHDNVHHALDEVVRVAYGKGGDGTLTPAQLARIIAPYTVYAQDLITRAVEAVRFKIPKIYTLSVDHRSTHRED